MVVIGREGGDLQCTPSQPAKSSSVRSPASDRAKDETYPCCYTGANFSLQMCRGQRTSDDATTTLVEKGGTRGGEGGERSFGVWRKKCTHKKPGALALLFHA